MHCIISGGGLTPDGKLRRLRGSFFIPVRILRDKFWGKYLACLSSLYESGSLVFSSSCKSLRNPYSWKGLLDRLYKKEWCPYIKETFNGFGNAIEYLERYTHKIALSNSRILDIMETDVLFSAREKKREIRNAGSLFHTRSSSGAT